MANHDIIVVGASAGGIHALVSLVEGLPADLPASILIVQHVPPHTASMLPENLSRSGPLPARHPVDGEVIRKGQIYIAVPDHHLLLEKGKVLVKRGPKENRFRPSIDALFRSAAYSYGPRVIGVVLSGSLDDGTSGLWTVKRMGGLAVVQNPLEAAFPSMPMNALQEVEIDKTVSVAEMGPLLNELVGNRTVGKPTIRAKELKRVETEVKIAVRDNAFQMGIIDMGELTPFTCPECNGALTRLKEGRIIRFRCRTIDFTCAGPPTGVQ